MTNLDADTNNRKKLRILVAEDNEINQKLILRILETAGYRVDIVGNGRKAVALANRNQYDFILMDLQMPLMDGYEATRKIRELQLKAQSSELKSQFPTVPIIALTGGNIEAEMEKCRGLGMNDCIGKPVFRDQLLALVKKWTAAEPVGSDAGKARTDAGKPIAKKLSVHLPIDLDRALIEFMGNQEVLNVILNEFTANVRSQIKSIRQAFLSLDLKVIARHAHSIRGGAANLSAHQVASIASALEKAAGLKQVELVKYLADDLEANLQQLEHYLMKENMAVHGVPK